MQQLLRINQLADGASSWRPYAWLLLALLLVSCDPKSPAPPDPDSPFTQKIEAATKTIFQDPGKAIVMAKEALAMPEAQTDPAGRARALRIVGVAHCELGEYDPALRFLDSALIVSTEAHDKAGIASALNNIGIVYDYQSYYALALRYYQDALRIREEIGDTKEIAKSYNNIGTVYYSLYRYKDALGYFRKTYGIVLKGGHDQGSSLLNMGSCYLNMGPVDSALYYFKKAEAWHLENADSLTLLMVRQDLAAAYDATGKRDEAIALAEQTLLQARKIGRHKSIINLTMQLGRYYVNDGQVQRGLDSLASAHKLLDLANDRTEYYTLQLHYKEIFSKLNKPEKALAAANEMIILSDSLFEVNNEHAVAELKVLYEAEKQQNRIEQLELEGRADRLRFWGASGVVVLVLVFSFVFFNRQRALLRREKELAESRRLLLDRTAALLAAEQINTELTRSRAEAERKQAEAERERLSAELAFKNREITNLALQIGVKNDLLHDLQDALRDFQPPRPAERERIHALLTDLNQRLHLDQDVAQVDQHVEQVQEGFLHRLEQLSPSLTKAERRLASYIRMELSSKEIAGLLNIAPRSVDVARHRLRKKLDLTEEANLTDYIRSV